VSPGQGVTGQLRVRVRLRCRGAVQGVGFRPTVHRLATARGLAGWVVNDPEGATVELEGDATRVEALVAELEAELPPLARLDGFLREELEPTGASSFEVRTSQEGRRSGALVPPDAALCADCRAEMDSPDDRHHHYPFTTCTNCGPRFSLVHSLPYDRSRTAMACFELCPACGREYADPGDRRFHAEPLSCPACGPRLWIVDREGAELAEGQEALELARRALLEGDVVAIKGIGGFQLACRADSEQAVARLRKRKARPSRPFAVMVRDQATARRLVSLSEEDLALMRSPRSPIVLAPRCPGSDLAPGVAPGLDDVGLLLPTAPLHIELLRDARMPPLVMTSGNLSEEPICRGNREAVERLGRLADLLLLHDRDIVRRVDDSVVRSTPDGPILVRRSRGWVPEPLSVPETGHEPVLALGGHLQTTACLATSGQAFVSQHIGDLDSEAARVFHREALAGLEQFLECTPTTIVADLHPDYPSTWLAAELAAERHGTSIGVQHHLAHAAAVLAEHGRFPAAGEKVLALSLDGTGWGADGSAWGGEWLWLDGDVHWQRAAHLEPLPLIGGEVAVREPWRVVAAALARAGDAELLDRLPLARQLPRERLHQVRDLALSPTWPLASGAGRVFEAGGALLGLTTINSWEGEAAARLEALAGQSARRPEPWGELCAPVPAGKGHGTRLASAELLAAAARRLIGGEPAVDVAAGFHTTFCRLAVDLTCRVAGTWRGLVALGGGCMVNRLLLTGLGQGLGRAGFEVLRPQRLPPGDGALSYGQAVLAATAQVRERPLEALERPSATFQPAAPSIP